MKMWASTAIGGPDTLALYDAAPPVPAPGEVLVAIEACGINFPDSLIIEDRYQFKPARPFAPGGEIAGIVRDVGEGVTALSIGDRVIARTGWGGLAGFVAVPVSICAVMPPDMPFEEGAAFLFTYATAYHALVQRARIAQGERVLVLGGAGGTGVATIELAKAFGATVCAAVSSDEKADFARACGADETIVYPPGPLDSDAARALGTQFKAFGGSDGIDIVFDPVGGDYAEPALRAMAWKGRYLVVGFTAGIPRLPFNLPLLKGCEIVGVFNGGLNANEPAVAEANIRALIALYGEGKLRPRVSHIYAFADGPRAIEAIAARGALGKLVVRVGEPARD
ncbi:NADPH:quinone oxidoreductase family protein [Sphingomonas baiyangensis]|uniref:NADPH:quinone oxidoreductase family protein n=1 Tax=Sphingomonas baiyangensis TaxID=2572576 RepID=A0A4U1L5T2_9SPHN|nr:NADPH:quinone oxidoreductase family protein [Sphingomonas baiyangensis]TKD51566.1 NADPH:quinone oxidoreductase family protein [Sphingomonas baiyangensis]